MLAARLSCVEVVCNELKGGFLSAMDGMLPCVFKKLRGQFLVVWHTCTEPFMNHDLVDFVSTYEFAYMPTNRIIKPFRNGCRLLGRRDGHVV